MRKQTGRTILSALLTLALVLTGCTGKNAAAVTVTEKDSEKPLQIGLSFDSFVIERWIRDRDIFVSTAEKLGAQVNVQNANRDVHEQIAQIEYLISKQVDVMAVVAGDCDLLTDVMKKAKDAGIKTLCYDRLITNADCDLFISFDNRQVGRLMGESMRKNIPEGGDIFMIQGPLTDKNVLEIRKGFCQAIRGSGLNVVYEPNCEEWIGEQGYDYTKAGLEKFPDIKGVMCGNDDVATHVFRALSEARLAGDVVLTGQDGDLMACQRVMEGTQAMTAFKSVEEEARLAAIYAVKLGRGESLEDITKTIHDGAYNVPYLELAPVAVTKENMDEVIIRGGFHAQEDVYLNVNK